MQTDAGDAGRQGGDFGHGRAGDGLHRVWLERRRQFARWWWRPFIGHTAFHRRMQKLEALTLDPANTRHIIVNSDMVRGEIAQHFPAFPQERVHLVRNGVDPRRFQGIDRIAARKRLGLSEDDFVLLFVGSGWERKGLTTALGALDMLDSTTLLVAGRGPADLYRHDKARFLGPVADIASLFAAADVLVAPTWYDPFSNACLEGLAAGLPVITTPANGFSEILKPGVHGDITPTGESLALAEAVEKWRDPQKLVAAREACRSLASGYSIERNARETLEILARTASAR